MFKTIAACSVGQVDSAVVVYVPNVTRRHLNTILRVVVCAADPGTLEQD